MTTELTLMLTKPPMTDAYLMGMLQISVFPLQIWVFRFYYHVRFSFFFQYGFTSNKSSSLTLISNSFPHFLLASLSPFIHIYWCLLDGNIWSWRLMALYISLKKGKEKTLHTSSELHLFPVCFFLLTVSFSELFLLLCHFFPLCVSFQQNPSSEEQFVYVSEALEVLSIQL